MIDAIIDVIIVLMSQNMCTYVNGVPCRQSMEMYNFGVFLKHQQPFVILDYNNRLLDSLAQFSSGQFIW
jgi:hypothetical protein